MGRNLYILAGTLFSSRSISFGVSYTNVAQQPGSPGDISLWRTMGLALFVISMVVALAAVLSRSSSRPSAAPTKPVEPGANARSSPQNSTIKVRKS